MYNRQRLASRQKYRCVLVSWKSLKFYAYQPQQLPTIPSLSEATKQNTALIVTADTRTDYVFAPWKAVKNMFYTQILAYSFHDKYSKGTLGLLDGWALVVGVLGALDRASVYRLYLAYSTKVFLC